MLSLRSDCVRRTIGIATSVLILSIACVAQADPEDLFGRRGFFVGGGASYRIPTDDIEDKLEQERCSNRCSYDADESWGFHLNGGFRHTKNIWSQLEFEFFAGANASSNGAPNSPTHRILSTSLQINVGVPLGAVRLFVFGGPGVTIVDHDSGGDTKGGLSLRGGGGFDLAITDYLSVTLKAAYVKPWQDAEDYDYYATSLGFAYHF